MVTIHCYIVSIDFIAPNIMAEQKEKGYQGIRTMKHLSRRKQEVTSNIVITKKMKSSISDYSKYNSDPRDIDDFTDKPKFQCDIQIVKNTYADDT